MPSRRAVSDLIGEDRAFQERVWTAQRLAWALFGLGLFICLLGLAGAGGPFARREVTSGPARIDYPRAMRWNAADEIRVHVPAGGNELLSVTLSSRFLDSFEVENVAPMPLSVVSTRGGASYRFLVVNGADANMTFSLRATEPDLHFSGTVQVGTEPPAPLAMMILP